MQVKIESMNFLEFQSIAEQHYKDGILLQDETKKKIEDDIRGANSSCPCGENNTCANIGSAIPIILNKYGFTKINDSISKRKLLIDDIKCREEQKSNYSGRIIYYDNKPCTFFLMSGNVILRFITTGEKCTEDYSVSDMFALLLKNEENECYIYTDVSQDVLENHLKLKVTELGDLTILNVDDHRDDKKLFNLQNF